MLLASCQEVNSEKSGNSENSETSKTTSSSISETAETKENYNQPITTKNSDTTLNTENTGTSNLDTDTLDTENTENTENTLDTASTETIAQSTTTETTTTAASADNSSSEVIQEEDTTWAYTLINTVYPLEDGYIPELASIEGNWYFDARAAKYAKKMIADARADGMNLYIISSYRTIEKQTTNFNNFKNSLIANGYSETEAFAITRTQIMLPGSSEHNAALAIDFNVAENYFEDTKEYAWLIENCTKYGFIPRYLKGKEDKQDGIIYEPWHFRFIGFEYAKDIKDSGLTLEEYMGLNNFH